MQGHKPASSWTQDRIKKRLEREIQENHKEMDVNQQVAELGEMMSEKWAKAEEVTSQRVAIK